MITGVSKQDMHIYGNWKRARTVNTGKLLEWENRAF